MMSYNKKKLKIGNSKEIEKTNTCTLFSRILDIFSLGIKPPEDILVKAKLTESSNLKFVKLYKIIIKIVEIKYINKIFKKLELKLLQKFLPEAPPGIR